MIKFIVLGISLLLSGCSTALKPLDYRAQRAYVPMSVSMQSPASRFEEEKQRQVIQVLRDTGAFSFLDGSLSKTGYSLLIDEPGGKGAGLVSILGALTLLTVPVPYTYERNIRGRLFKNGQLIKTYDYHRGGWSVMAWYIPMAEPEAQRQMLDELMRDMDKDRLVPYQ